MISILVYALAPISGAHLVRSPIVFAALSTQTGSMPSQNPAISFGLGASLLRRPGALHPYLRLTPGRRRTLRTAFTKKITVVRLLAYTAAQVVGAIIGTLMAAHLNWNTFRAAGGAVNGLPLFSGREIVAAEVLATALLVTIVCAAIDPARAGASAGLRWRDLCARVSDSRSAHYACRARHPHRRAGAACHWGRRVCRTPRAAADRRHEHQLCSFDWASHRLRRMAAAYAHATLSASIDCLTQRAQTGPFGLARTLALWLPHRFTSSFSRVRWRMGAGSRRRSKLSNSRALL